MATKTFDLGLNNANLYNGCEITEVGGRLTLVTKPELAANILGRNTLKEIEATPVEQRAVCEITGAMAVWAYLVVFHHIVHKFGEVWYNDGRGNRVLVAKH